MVLREKAVGEFILSCGLKAKQYLCRNNFTKEKKSQTHE